MFIKGDATGYLISGDQFKIQTGFGLFCPLVNFRLISLFVKSKQIWSFDAGETHTRSIVLARGGLPCGTDGGARRKFRIKNTQIRHAMSFNDKDIIIECFYLNVVFKSIVFLHGTLNENLAA